MRTCLILFLVIYPNPNRETTHQLLLRSRFGKKGNTFMSSSSTIKRTQRNIQQGEQENNFLTTGDHHHIDPLETNEKHQEAVGQVLRLAAREYHPQHSRPSSRSYTTRKDERDMIQVDTTGVHGDYNHYRTLALDSTPNRALSIVTQDILHYLQSYGYPVKYGDLGENVLISNVTFEYFIPAQQYIFYNRGDGSSIINVQNVVIEITEPIIPCANLCKLPYINDETKTPKERIETCQDLLALLDQQTGLRGWYAKIVQGGTIHKESLIAKRCVK